MDGNGEVQSFPILKDLVRRLAETTIKSWF